MATMVLAGWKACSKETAACPLRSPRSSKCQPFTAAVAKNQENNGQAAPVAGSTY